jgi:AAA15 family ATPase/GTPase
MIHSIIIENFKSINKPQYLSLVIDKRFKRSNHNLLSGSGTMLALVQVIVGPNASGKTNIIDAIAAIRWLFVEALQESYSLDRIFPHFAANNTKKPTKITIVFEKNNAVYEYKISIINKEIESESLRLTEKTKVRSTKKTLFERVRKGKGYEVKVRDNFFKSNFKNMDDKDLRSLSLLTIGSFFGDKDARDLINYWKRVETNLDPTPAFSPPAGYEMEMALMRMGKPKQVLRPFDRFDKDIQSFNKVNGKFKHIYGDNKFELSANQESSGTQRYIVMLEKLNNALENGSVAIIDELDAYLHPKLVNSLVGQFFDKKKNKHGAQLLFSTHSLEIMESLSPYQIILVNKSNSTTELTRLDQHPYARVRSDENYYLRYLSGDYGALPIIK